MLFIAIEITGPLEITRAERHQRVNSHPPILGAVLAFQVWLCFLPDLCPKSPFQLHGRADTIHVCRSGWETCLPCNTPVKERDSHQVKNPLLARNQPARQVIRSADFPFCPCTSPTRKPNRSLKQIWWPRLHVLAVDNT